MGVKHKILMNCQSATAVVEKKRDGKLAFTERLGLWIHLSYCSLCALFFQQSKILDDSAKSYATKVTNEQKAYKLDNAFKDKLSKDFEQELKK